MKQTINISTLRRLIFDQGLDFLTVFGNGEKVDLCSNFDNGDEPYNHYLGLDGNAEILGYNEASPIWENLLEGIEKKRPIYRITDDTRGDWMELVTLEKRENEE